MPWPLNRSNAGGDLVLLQSVLFFICILTGASDISRKKSKISRDFRGQIRGKIGRFRGIFAGKKSKFAEQSADFGRFSREKSQNSRNNRPISRDFRGKKVKIRRTIGRFRAIFAGKKSKFAEQSADFGRFSREKSQNSQKNRPISRDFSGKKSIFEEFSEANF